MTTAKPLFFLALSLVLASCSAPKKPPVVEAPATHADVETSPPLAADSWQYKIVEAAKEEWIFFGRQKVVIDGDEESIPHVGTWEDDDYAHSERINQYWRSVGMDRLSGMDCKQPWSAAFISWVMHSVGVPHSLFPPAQAHKTYLSHFLSKAQTSEAVMIPHAIKDYRPKPGDLICANRGRGYFGDVVEEVPEHLNSKLHCDIVVETQGQTLQAIGGNVRNSVSKTVLNLTPDGHLQLSSHRPWFLVIENRLN